MHHVQLMRAAAPILKANPEGGVYLMTLSVAVWMAWPSTQVRKTMAHSWPAGYNHRREQYAVLSHKGCWGASNEMPRIHTRAEDQSKRNPPRPPLD